MKRSALPRVGAAAHGLDAPEAEAVLAALAQPWRLQTFRLLVRYLPYGLSAGDIARLVALPHNTLSAHLAILEQAGLVRSRREGRSIIFAAVRERALHLANFLAHDCCGSAAIARLGAPSEGLQPVPAKREIAAPTKRYNVLVLCTGNSARSLLAEALLNRESEGRLQAYSAGSHPKRKPDPYAIALLQELGYDVSGLRAKSWNQFAGADTPVMDFVVTVCDAAAAETCPNWPGHPLAAHWGIPDPGTVAGTESQRRAAVVETYRQLAARVSAFVNLDIERLDLATLKQRLADIGRMDGATPMARQLAA